MYNPIIFLIQVVQPFFVGSEFSHNVYSQYGEDGILEEVLKRLHVVPKFAMEFGAWDGKHYSNTYSLSLEGVKCVMVEGDGNKFKDLLATSRHNKNIIPVQRFVQESGPDSVDAILNELGIFELDILSIDIDSYDGLIFRSLAVLPKVVICEFNPTFGICNQHLGEIGTNIGTSLFSLLKIAEAKGYSLASITNTNLFFVQTSIVTSNNLNPLDCTALHLLSSVDSCGYRVASGYDGSRISFGSSMNPWDGTRIAKIVDVPFFSKKWPPRYWHLVLRAVLTLTPLEILKGLKKAKQKGWF
jgi:hypothetical protein